MGRGDRCVCVCWRAVQVVCVWRVWVCLCICLDERVCGMCVLSVCLGFPLSMGAWRSVSKEHSIALSAARSVEDRGLTFIRAL